MKANCENCFFGKIKTVDRCVDGEIITEEQIECINTDSYRIDFDGEIGRTCGGTWQYRENDDVCSNWQAKNTDDMKCRNCHYWKQFKDFNYSYSGDKMEYTDYECLKGNDHKIGCIKFWPKDEE